MERKLEKEREHAQCMHIFRQMEKEKKEPQLAQLALERAQQQRRLEFFATQRRIELEG